MKLSAPRYPTRQTTAILLVALLLTGGVTGALAVVGNWESTDQHEISFQQATSSGLDYEDDASGVGNGNAGVYVLDYDNDGWQDLLTIGSGPALFANTAAGTGSGDPAFERTDAFAGVQGQVKSAVVFDYDGDGWTDIVLLRPGAEPLAFHNDQGTFERADLGFGEHAYPTGGAAADYDGDGDLDLLVIQSGDWAEGKPAGYAAGSLHVEDDNGNPNVLYENTGDGFERTDTVISDGAHWSLATSFVDLTGDGRPDIHVANDYNNDTIYVNTGDGFERRYLGGNTARNGMESAIADVNGDTRPDVFVTNIYLPISRENMTAERYERLERYLSYVIHSSRTKGNTLLANSGGGEFEDRADALGVRHGGWGWAADFADFDNDGDEDLLHSTQKVVRINRSNPVYTYPMLWERGDDGFTRLDASARGLRERDSRGMVTLDYDRDGDRDVVTATYDGQFVVYENTVDDSTHSLAFQVVDSTGATAIGAVVTVETPDGTQTRYQTAESGYLSQSSRVQHVGLGPHTEVDITVTWPDGTTTTYENVPGDRQIRITRTGIETVANVS